MRQPRNVGRTIGGGGSGEGVDLSGLAARTGAEFTGTSPIDVDEATAMLLLTMPDGTVNGLVVKIDSAAGGYGQGQALLVLEEGAGDATDQTAAGKILARIDDVGSLGTQGAIHVATGLRKAVPGAVAAVWLTPEVDVPAIVANRPAADSTADFVRLLSEADVELLVISKDGFLAAAGNLVGGDVDGSGATSVQIGNTFGVAGVLLGDDVIIFRSAADELTIGDKTIFSAGATIRQQINAQTGTSYTPVPTDEGKIVTLANAGAITVTLPQDSVQAIPVGASIDFAWAGAGQPTFALGAGAAWLGGTAPTPTLKLRAVGSFATAIKMAANTWALVGDLASS